MTLYSYYPSSGLELHAVTRDRKHGTATIPHGFTGELIRWSEVDGPGGRYFTTARAAIESFIAKAEAALADPTRCSRNDRRGWLKVLTAARKRLAEIGAAKARKGRP